MEADRKRGERKEKEDEDREGKGYEWNGMERREEKILK